MKQHLILPVVGVSLCLVAACGGQVEGESGGDPAEEADDEPTDDPESSNDDSEEPSPPDSDEPGPGERQLAECELGFEPYSADQPCNWVADGLCYETKEEACDCICPRDADSVCLSGFYDGPDSQTEVICN